MADDIPSNTPSGAQFKLPEDITTLAQMRDQLSDYLNTLERNTDSVTSWLQKNQNNIIVGHHQLSRAVAAKDETKALGTLRGLGDATGFVLSLQDFAARGTAAFGADSSFAKAVAKTAGGVPPAILEDLPEIKTPDASAPLTSIKPLPPEPQSALPPEAPANKWWNPGTWFAKDEANALNAEEEAARRLEEIKRHWKLVRSELISLQSDRHYYIDSFMDWVGESLAPEDGTENPAADKLMEKYQNPQFVIDLAGKDYSEVMSVKVDQLRVKALDYSTAAALIDSQDIAGFVAALPRLFPKPETNQAKQQKELLLQDFGVISFAELALTRVEKRADQLLLLEAALKVEPEFKLTGAASKAEIFARVFAETLSAKNPLPTRAIDVTLRKLRDNGKPEAMDLLGLKNSGPTVFTRVADRFKDNLKTLRATMQALTTGVGAPDRGLENHLANYVSAVDTKDSAALTILLFEIDRTGNAQSFKSLLQLTYPGRSLAADIASTANGNAAALARLVTTGLNSGLLDEFKTGTNAAAATANAAANFIAGNNIVGNADFSVTAMRQLLGTAYANGGLDVLRRQLTAPNGWLEQVVKGPLAPEGKSNWIAALLEPFASDIVKSNILAEAAAKAADKTAGKTLADMDANLTGGNIRLDDGRILTNVDRIANIWYSAEAKTLRFTVSGTGHVLADEISPPMAQEILANIQRKAPGFDSEYDGLYNPKNLERIVTTAQGTQVYWQNRTGILNVQDSVIDALHKRDDFMHVTDAKGHTQSVNLKSIALLQPLSDGTSLLVDKYGDVQILEGKVTLKATADLLDLGGTFFNPKNASIVSLNDSKTAVDFRCESNEFDSLLKSAAPDQYFYSVELGSKADLRKIEQVLKDAPTAASPGGASAQLYFNIDRLGYLMHDEGRDTGFACRKYGPSKKPGFILVDEDFAQSIYDGLAANKDLFTVANVITHKSMIDDAYYSTEKQRFYLVVGNDILQVPCDEATAYKALKQLAKEPGFTVVGASTIKNPNGVGTVELPADIVNLGRTVMQFYSEAQDKTFLVADNEKFFNIGLDRKQSRQLFDTLEEDGLKAAKAATALNAWTQKLKDTAASLPQLTIRMTPSLTEHGREYLLRQLIEGPSENVNMPQPKADFSIAATQLRTNDKFDYPARTRKAAPVSKSPRL
ncbi:MAG: hypothetical protein PW788_11980 [Micavibrio sp.]|nr:hypothetical protein [Micavibrio sp.]